MKKYILSLALILIFQGIALPAAAEERDTLKLLDLFGDVFEKVREEYVEEPTDENLIEAAINGMLTDLDPHSSYLSKKAFKEMQVQTRGEFGGLGIEVTMDKGLVKIVSPIDDTPADKAGIMPGDYITHINGDAVLGMSLSEAVEKMRGKVGTEIKLTILREDGKEPIDIKIIRDIIKIKSVRSRTEGDVAYIRITSFSEQTDKSLIKEIERQQDNIGKDLRGLVLDLRNNPGGLLDQAIAVADAFLEKGEIVSTRGRVPDSTKRFNSTEGDLINGLPIVVLINGGSASASEIVAGALQDHKRALVLGTKSFGKGSVQTVIPLPGDSAMRLTTSRYYTPSGSSIQAKGITPDIIVEPAKLEYFDDKLATSEANLRGHLDNDQEKETRAPKITVGSKKDDDDETGKSIYQRDYQLGRAVDLLRALNLYNSSVVKSPR